MFKAGENISNKARLERGRALRSPHAPTTKPQKRKRKMAKSIAAREGYGSQIGKRRKRASKRSRC